MTEWHVFLVVLHVYTHITYGYIFLNVLCYIYFTVEACYWDAASLGFGVGIAVIPELFKV